MSATRSRPGDDSKTEPATSQGIWESIYKFFSSIKFTVLLLTLIAAGSVFGTVVKQGAPADEYLSYYSESTYRFIKFFGLDDTYHAPWFYTLILLFVVNLCLCTIGRLTRFIRSGHGAARLPGEDALAGMEMHFTAKDGSPEEIERALGRGYRCLYREPEGAVYEKGALSRYGVYIIHASIILILAGGFVGAVLGYKGYMILNVGEVKDRISMRAENTAERPLGFALKCKDFKVSFYPGGEPKDYVSSVEVIDNGKTVAEKDIRVNDPLSYKGVHVYQASYGRTPLFRFNIGGDNVTLKEREAFKQGDFLIMVVRFQALVHNFGPGVQVAFLEDGKPKTVWFLKDVAKFRQRSLSGVEVTLTQIDEQFYTGLEVAKDPGIWFVWTGFALILFGLYVNFFTFHRRIYVRSGPQGMIVAGFASKGKEPFAEEFKRLKDAVKGDGP